MLDNHEDDDGPSPTKMSCCARIFWSMWSVVVVLYGLSLFIVPLILPIFMTIWILATYDETEMMDDDAYVSGTPDIAYVLLGIGSAFFVLFTCMASGAVGKCLTVAAPHYFDEEGLLVFSIEGTAIVEKLDRRRVVVNDFDGTVEEYITLQIIYCIQQQEEEQDENDKTTGDDESANHDKYYYYRKCFDHDPRWQNLHEGQSIQIRLVKDHPGSAMPSCLVEDVLRERHQLQQEQDQQDPNTQSTCTFRRFQQFSLTSGIGIMVLVVIQLILYLTTAIYTRNWWFLLPYIVLLYAPFSFYAETRGRKWQGLHGGRLVIILPSNSKSNNVLPALLPDPISMHIGARNIASSAGDSTAEESL